MSESSDGSAAAASATDGLRVRAREQALVRATLVEMRQGHLDAYGRIVELYQQRLLNLVLPTLRDRGSAEDIVQEAFMRAYTHLHVYDVQRDFYPWLATIAIRLAQNCRRCRREAVSDETEAHENAMAAGDVLGDVLLDERARRLWAAVDALPAAEKTVVVMYYRQDMKVEEIARVLGVTSGTVKTLLFRARAKLRPTMQDEITRESLKESAL